MRRVAPAVVAVLMTLLPSSALAGIGGSDPIVASGAAPAEALRVRQRAIAQWLVTREGEAFYYVAFAVRRVDPDALTTIAGAGRIHCSVERGRTFTNMICDGRIAVEDQPVGAFSIDPLLREASLDTRIDGRRVEVTWRAREDSPRLGPGLPSPQDPRLLVEMERHVVAGGRVLGTRVRPKSKIHQAELGQGALIGGDLPSAAGFYPVSFEVRVLRSPTSRAV